LKTQQIEKSIKCNLHQGKKQLKGKSYNRSIGLKISKYGLQNQGRILWAKSGVIGIYQNPNMSGSFMVRSLLTK